MNRGRRFDPFLTSNEVANAMNRDKFEKIKAKIKYHKPEDADSNDKIWRVRTMFDILGKILENLGYF